MAFDFLSYMVQQAEQQPSLFADQTKLQRQQSLAHLMALQLAALIDIAAQQPQQLQHIVEHLEQDALSEQVLKYLLGDDTAVQFFDSQAIKVHSSVDLSAQLLLSELKQLIHNAQLDPNQLTALLDGQYPWMQAQVQPWFWDCIAHPEYKLSAEEVLSDSDQAQESTEMNPTSAAELEHHHANDQQSLEPTAPQALYLFISPLLALLIIIFLFKSVF